MNRRLGSVALAAGSLAAIAGVAGAFPGGAQPAPAAAPELSGKVDFWTKVGSFKIASPKPPDVLARGDITMNFQGTVLVVGLVGSATPGPGVKVQYENAKQGRKVFFGRGKLNLKGKWRAIQFFGRDFKGSWTGMGIMRLYGEFDEKLETGFFQINGKARESWGNGGRTINLPPPVQPGQIKPKIEDIKPAKTGG